MRSPTPTGHEIQFDPDEIIVSKTDLRGRLTYANRVFLRVAGYTEDEVLGAPHSLIRHPDMPRCVFQLLWNTIQAERELFAYVVNLAKNGDHYWVLAHVTPSFDAAGQLVGFHSNRRVPERRAVERVRALYDHLRAEERRLGDSRAGMEAGTRLLEAALDEHGAPYDEFVFSL